MKRIFVYEYSSGGGGGSGGGSGAGSASSADDGSSPDDHELSAAGRAMRDAVAADLLGREDYDVTVATAVPGAPLAQGAHAISPRDGESAFDFVARQADAHHLTWVIAPETGGVLARLHGGIDADRWLGCDAAAIHLASAKRATLLRLGEHGITTPLAFEHAPEITRWVVKPDDGAGALATHLHTSPEAAWEDWAQRSRAGSPMAIEPWVEGPALSVSLLCSAERTELLSINRQHLSLDDAGVLSFRSVQIDAWPRDGAQAATLEALAARITRCMPGLHGFVGVDLVWHAQRGPVVIEINPRVTCAYVGLSQALGRNLAADVIDAHSRGRTRPGGTHSATHRATQGPAHG
ncbi:hypothetical protein BH11PSE8_BH11PSE8_20300 [soil metagenome]